MVKAISDVITNEKKYITMRENAINLAQEYDTYALLERYFKLLDITV